MVNLRKAVKKQVLNAKIALTKESLRTSKDNKQFFKRKLKENENVFTLLSITEKDRQRILTSSKKRSRIMIKKTTSNIMKQQKRLRSLHRMKRRLK